MEEITVIDAITKRSSKRKFLDKAVPKDIQEKILSAANMTPSGANMQPWIVYAISNKDVLDSIGQDIIDHIEGAGILISLSSIILFNGSIPINAAVLQREPVCISYWK